MLMLWRSCRQSSRIPVKSLYSQAGVAQPVLDPTPSLINIDSPWTRAPGTPCVEGFQGELQDVSVSEAKRLLSIATAHSSQDVSVQGIQENYTTLAKSDGAVRADLDQHPAGLDIHSSVLDGINSHVSLHGCMQSNVPHPHSTVPSPGNASCYGYSSYHNMPGSSNRLHDKYIVGALNLYHPSRHFSSSISNGTSVQGTQPNKYEGLEDGNNLEDPTPQGIQGDDCVRFKLWMENCQRYSLPNCDEQMQALRTGRKTLAEVFMEQQLIIEKVAEDWRKRNQMNLKLSQTSSQGVQESSYNFEYSNLDDPCPQGLQGEDCANYKAWMINCKALGFGDCEDKIQSVREGQKTLRDIFEEQDELIHKIVKNFQQKRSYSTSTSDSEVRSSNSSPGDSTPSSDGNSNLSQRDKFKRAIKEYGGTVVVFHIGISLISLGGFYLAVSSGLDVVGILTKIGVGESILQSRIAQGSTTFVIAYAVHKVFAPVRIGITLTCTPFIVRHLRNIGFLKQPKGAGTGNSK